MPHFSPISWLLTGFVFYFVLMLLVGIFWWMQNYQFPSFNLNSSKIVIKKWNWS